MYIGICTKYGLTDKWYFRSKHITDLDFTFWKSIKYGYKRKRNCKVQQNSTREQVSAFREKNPNKTKLKNIVLSSYDHPNLWLRKENIWSNWELTNTSPSYMTLKWKFSQFHWRSLTVRRAKQGWEEFDEFKQSVFLTKFINWLFCVLNVSGKTGEL